MKRYRLALLALAVAAALAPGFAHADMVAPQVQAPCAADLAGAMTLLPDERTYVTCQEGAAGYDWAAAPVAFEPNDTWLSYGPAITLHGQGMRNPNLTSGRWTATPRDSETVCRAQQETVVEAGVLSTPQLSEGEPGQPLEVAMAPKLFYVELAGNCLWERD
jgi:hypothetical protein